MQQSHEQLEFACPTCNSVKLYRLADRRFKCSVCRRVFSKNLQKEPRISSSVREQLAISFWDMKSASETSELLKLNIKTVQKYYSLLRENLSRVNRAETRRLYGTEQISASAFNSFLAKTGQHAMPAAALLSNGDCINQLRVCDIALTPEYAVSRLIGWIYARDNDSFNHLQLDHFHCAAIDSDSIALTAPFWMFVKQGLLRYQGGFRHHFPLFLQEMEFRYNDRRLQKGLDICFQLMAAD